MVTAAHGGATRSFDNGLNLGDRNAVLAAGVILTLALNLGGWASSPYRAAAKSWMEWPKNLLGRALTACASAHGGGDNTLMAPNASAICRMLRRCVSYSRA
jgi:hypothetical protein